MRLTFYANACCVMEADGFRVLTDPWLDDGVFEGSWCHYPPLAVRADDVLGADAIYISHLHPDHFDRRVMDLVPRDKPIIALDRPPNFLLRLLKEQGFTNIIAIKHEQTRTLGPFTLTMYQPFAAHVFHESELGNLIDSALVTEDAVSSVFNANDNTPSLDAARMLAARHPALTLAQLNYNAAGPYPSCFDNLTHDDKRREHHRVLERNLAHMIEVAKILAPKAVMPFAGAYVIGGKQWPKNEVLGTTTIDHAGAAVRDAGLTAIVLNEGESVVLPSLAVSAPYRPIDLDAQARYIRDVLATRDYDWESDPLPDRAELVRDLGVARARLWQAQQRFKVTPACNVYIDVGDGDWFGFDFATEPSGLTRELVEPMLTCRMDRRLLARILHRTAHWNNAEIGCHIDFERRPNVYLRDLHTLMAMFQLPV